MQFGAAIGTACSTFAITNIDDMFVLVTFYAEAATNKTLTPLKITLGQFLGFTIIVAISMIGFGVSLVLPYEPIGFLGLLPLLLGVWKFFDLLFPTEEEESENTRIAGMKSILKVSVVTLMNGGDNIGTYIPLFSQAKGAEIAIYVIVYYILLGVWCLVAWLIMGQKRLVRVVERYMNAVIPFLFLGLGIYIIVKSSCFPWSIEQIDNKLSDNPGRLIMAIITTFLLLVCIGFMLWNKLRKQASQRTSDSNNPEGDSLPTLEDTIRASDAPFWLKFKLRMKASLSRISIRKVSPTPDGNVPLETKASPAPDTNVPLEMKASPTPDSIGSV